MDYAIVTIRCYVSAVWYRQKLLRSPTFGDDFLLKQTLNGIERVSTGSKVPERYPLTARDLLNIHSLLDLSINDDLVFWIAVVICFRGLLRISHVTKSPHTLRAGEVCLGAGFVSLRVISSKTDQFGRSPYTIHLCDIPGSPMNISGLLSPLLASLPPKGPLLNFKEGKFLFPLTYSYVNDRLKGFALLLNLPVSRVSTHSLRHGGTALLQALGLPVSSIMIRGNWKSSAVHRYLHHSSKEMLSLDATPATYFSGLM